MKRVPIAKISNEQESINVFFPDYWEDIEAGIAPPKPHLDYREIPDCDATGSEELREDFLLFARINRRDDYSPYPWSNAVDIANRFAKENDLKYEDIFPKALQEEVDKAYNPNTRY
jgi:hypothetical protein